MSDSLIMDREAGTVRDSGDVTHLRPAADSHSLRHRVLRRTERASVAFGRQLSRRPLWVLSVLGLTSGLAAPILDGLASTPEVPSFAWTIGISAVVFVCVGFALLGRRGAIAELRGIGLGAALKRMFRGCLQLVDSGGSKSGGGVRAARVARGAKALGVVAFIALVLVNVATACMALPSVFVASSPLTFAAIRLLFGLAAFTAALVMLAERLRVPPTTLTVDDWYDSDPSE